MKRVSVWSLVAVLVLLLYIVLTLLFRTLFQEVFDRQLIGTRASEPTFTSMPVATVIVVVTVPSKTPLPSSTPTPTPTPEATPTARPTATPVARPAATPTPVIPQLVSAIAVNIRSGPGTNYPVIGVLPPNNPLVVIGRNEPGTWWQVQRADGTVGWLAASVVEVRDVGGVPIASAPTPPPPEPTPTPAPPAPTRQVYQYEPTGWYDDTNYGLTRFLGNITDVDGNPVNGVFVEAQCGDFRIISNPSGPVGWGPFDESSTWPPGFYDITLDNKPIACHWFLSVVATEDRQTVTARLSEVVEVETTIDKSIIVANWRKNY